MINKNQEIIIKKAQTPAAIIAGPGTGKTFTIVQKVINLIKEENIDPNRILITTFTKKAAKELIERVESELKKSNIKLDTSKMMIGNFHSLALEFLREYRVFYKEIFSSQVIDAYMEGYLIENNLNLYKSIKNFDLYIKYAHVKMIQEIFSDITNNLIDLDILRKSDDPKDIFAYDLYTFHMQFLQKNKLINYQMILKRFYDLLSDEFFGQKIRASIDYVIIDEYQDTNYIQQEIGFKLVREKNIMVFGDDDQSLYSFRGSDPKNLLDFDNICLDKLGKAAKFYYLNVNYRSNQNIIDKANIWLNMEKIWDDKFEKNLLANDKNFNQNTFVRARSENYENLYKIIKLLNKSINFNQMAFLFPSLNSQYPKSLQSYLESKGIEVLNKNSGMYFNRPEIRLLMYLILNVFSIKPNQKEGSSKSNYIRQQQTEFKTYILSIFEDDDFLSDKGLNDFIKDFKEIKDENISYSSFIYRAFSLEKFQEILKADLLELEDIRKQSNIAKFTSLVSDYENLYFKEELDYRKKAVDFIYSYIFYMFKYRAINELEDFETPKNCINFMTIHQSKGLEFDLVFVSGLNDYPRGEKEKFLSKYKRYEIGLESKIRDFYRKYFTAFTRAKKMCVILDNSRDKNLQKFQEKIDRTSDISTIDFIAETTRKDKPILAYTTDISLYESCSLKYKFLRRLKFTSPLTKSLIFGLKVHQLSEYISYLKKNDYGLYSLNEFIIENKEFNKVCENFISRDFRVKDAEVNYKTDRGFYILQGNVDLLLEDNSILDIKTGKEKIENLEKYKKQIITYYNLIKLNYKEVNHIYIYYIEEDKLLEFDKDDFDIEKIDAISKNIVFNDYYEKTENIEECKTCPMKYYCKRA